MKALGYLAYRALPVIALLAAATAHAQPPAADSLIRWMRPGASPYTTVTFSPDGSIIGYAIAGGYIFSETTTGVVRATFQDEHAFRMADFSPDGKLIACADVSEGIRFLDGETFQQIDTIGKSRANYAVSVVFSPDGRQLLSVRNQSLLELWDVPTRTLQMRPNPAQEPGHNYSNTGFSPDGSRVAGLTTGNRVEFYSTENGELLDLVAPATGSLLIYDALGQPVATLAEGAFEAGEHIYRWRDPAAPGLYIISLRTEKGTTTYPLIYTH